MDSGGALGSTLTFRCSALMRVLPIFPITILPTHFLITITRERNNLVKVLVRLAPSAFDNMPIRAGRALGGWGTGGVSKLGFRRA